MTDRYMDQAARREQDRMAREEARIERLEWECVCGAELDGEERCIDRCDEGDRIDAIMERFGL